MIVVTGAAGFIGSVVAGFLNKKNRRDLILVDDFSRADKLLNYNQKDYAQLINRNEFVPWLDLNHSKVDFIIHLGARTDTTEFNYSIFEELNITSCLCFLCCYVWFGRVWLS